MAPYFRGTFMKLSNTTLFLIPSLIWGSTWYAIKFQIGTTDPLYSVAFRFFLAAFLLILFIMIKGESIRFSWKTHLYFMLQGVCLFGINYWLVYMSEEHLTSGLVAVIFGGLIFLNVFLSALFLKSKIHTPVVVGGVIGTVGIGLIFKDELSVFDFSDMNFLAFLMALGAMTLASCGNILSAHYQRKRIPIMQSNAFGMFYGAVMVTIIALLMGTPLIYDSSISYSVALIYLSVFGSVIAFNTYLSLLGKIGPGKAGYISLSMPVIALLFSTFLEGYHWTVASLIGLLMILTGMYIALQRKQTVKVETI